MMSWVNPFKWWSLLQEKRKWKNVNWHFINACEHHDVTRALNAVELMVQIARRANNRKLLLDTYHNLNICQQFIDEFQLPDEWIVYMKELQMTLDRELMNHPVRKKWWI
jgi:hypothetical protein